MNYIVLDKTNQQQLVQLFTSTFTTSEGEQEGQLIGKLVLELCLNIDHKDIFCFGVMENYSLLASIFFSRLRFDEPTQVYMLAPVAVRVSHQNQGLGQALINYGITELKRRSVDVVITYGDPSFYSKVGFEPLPQNVIPPPQTLSMPEGWLGQSLTSNPIAEINGRPTCVNAFYDPKYW